TGRPNVIVFQGSFHGRTVGTMALTTSKTVYKAGYQPLMPGVFVAPYPYAYRYGWSIDETIQFCLDELEGLFTSQTAPWETAAILIEPVLGEGGYVVPPESFMQALRKICDQHGIMLIVDEIQSGFGRTGRWFAHEYQDILPDIMTIAKGLGSGLPISGVISRLDIMKKWIPGSHGGTFGGNAVAAAGAVATVRAIRDENMLQNTLDRSKQLFAGLHNIQSDYPVIGDVRGLGLMIGVEFRDNLRRPDKTTCKAVAKKCLENGLMLLTCGPWDNVIRWIPPLVVTAAEIDQALDIFHHSMESVRS
ncbi:aminotransferase class III-fold pyridoxal phosphate-dependent enzyme, partial [bacterium]|nr:aminotransferase class III-fold pyridoxal phosphate-dependent enzyme [bacterium]